MKVEDLLRKCIEGDPKSWDEFVRRYQTLVIRSVRYKLKKIYADKKMPRDEFRDIVQDIFLSIWEKNGLASIREVESLEGWLVMVSINRTLNYCRQKRFSESSRMFSFEADISSSRSGFSLASVLPHPGPGPLDMAQSRELKMILTEEIDQMSYKKQLALKLNIFENKKQRDIAKIMNMPENTVATLISRGKKIVRKRMEEYIERNKV